MDHQELHEFCRLHRHKAIRALSEIAGTQSRAASTAFQGLLDFGFGGPGEDVALVLNRIEEMSDAEIEQIAFQDQG